MMQGIGRILLFVLSAFMFGLADGSAAAESSWKLRKELDGIQVYTRKVVGSPILELRGETEVDTDVNRASEFYEKVDRMMEWFYRSKEIKLIKTVSTDESLIYFAADLPWPLWDRDGVYRRVKSVDPATQRVVYTLRAEGEGYPRSKDRVRVNYLDGQWRFSPLPGGRTAVSYRMHTEAGGYIPIRIVNRFTVSLPFKTLRSFRSLLHREAPPSISAA